MKNKLSNWIFFFIIIIPIFIIANYLSFILFMNDNDYFSRFSFLNIYGPPLGTIALIIIAMLIEYFFSGEKKSSLSKYF